MTCNVCRLQMSQSSRKFKKDLKINNTAKTRAKKTKLKINHRKTKCVITRDTEKILNSDIIIEKVFKFQIWENEKLYVINKGIIKERDIKFKGGNQNSLR